jgi:hypothetical protein
MCVPDDIAQAVIFLASERSDLITGQVLAVDGGLLTGYGEDLRSVIRQRMDEAKGEENRARGLIEPIIEGGSCMRLNAGCWLRRQPELIPKALQEVLPLQSSVFSSPFGWRSPTSR